jgi:hypothetical protein
VQRCGNVLLDEFYKLMSRGILYFDDKYARLFCPCGCDDIVVLAIGPPNTVATRFDSPTWSMMIHDGRPTLHPSVNQGGSECKSRYWVKSGCVEWIKE